MKKGTINQCLIFCFCISLISCTKAVKPPRPPPSVSIAAIVQRDVPLYFDSIGLATPPTTVPVRPQVGGKLVATYVKEGDDVEAGQLLYVIDPRSYQAGLEQAESILAKDQALLYYAEKTEERYAKVVEEDYISKLTFEQYQSNTKSAKSQVAADIAALEQAKLNLEFSSVVAPVSGKISIFNIYVGNLVVASDPTAITVIRPSKPIDVTFSLPQQQFELVRKSQGDAGNWDFIASLPEDLDKTYSGKSYFIDNQLSQDTGTILIKGQLPNLDREIWPGEFLRVKVLQKIVPNALTVPQGAVLIGKDGPYLYSLDADNVVNPHNVTLISRTEEYIAIDSSTLQPGQNVITDGQINIAPGMKVNVIKPAEVSSSEA